MQYSSVYGCQIQGAHQVEPDPEAQQRKLWDDYKWERFKKKFDEWKILESLNSRQNAEQNLGQSLPERQRTRNTEPNCLGAAGGQHGSTGNHYRPPILPSSPNHPPAPFPLPVQRASSSPIPDSCYTHEHMQSQMENFIDTSNSRREGHMSSRSGASMSSITFYDGNGVHASSNAQSAKPGTSYCITTDIHQEPMNHFEEDSGSLYDELDEAQMMNLEKDEDSSQL